jgi:hypothetical protein
MPEGFLLSLIYSIIQEFPVYGIGQVWSHLKFTLGTGTMAAYIVSVARLQSKPTECGAVAGCVLAIPTQSEDHAFRLVKYDNQCFEFIAWENRSPLR